MRLKPTDLNDFRRRQARERKPVARAPFERHLPIKIPLRTGSPERCDAIIEIHGEGHALDARQLLELGKACIRAAGELASEGA